MVSAWSREEDIRHVKLAQPGRNNEMTMVARAMQQLFHALDLSWVPPSVKQLGHDVFMALGPDKWLTCGIYIVTGSIVLSRPFASGYLDATTQALWAAGAPACGWRNIRYVECPVPCRDAQNTTTKETLILSSGAATASTWCTITRSGTIKAWAASSSCRPPTSTGLIVCRERLGGLLRFYDREAA